MTSKEALEELKIYLPAIYSEVAKCLNTIKQDLERLEQLEKENQELKDKLNSEALDNWQLHCKYKEYKKAIEIIKSKNVDIFFLVNNCEFVLDNYNYEIEDDIMKYCYKDCSTLTQQECDLLKEVLEDDK